MNAETRAKDTAKIINASGDDHDLITAFGQVVIASAIRQAENDKLEEAAQCVRDNCLPAECHYALEAINALKHED